MMKDLMKRFWNEEEAMGVIEVVLIIVVLVGLALVFKTQINSIATTIFKKVKNQVSKF
jgi:Flp pilus assembly pilin Flp